MAIERWIIAGLGNPGRQYEQTWHNSGYQVLDRIARQQKLSIDRIRFRSLTAEWHYEQTSCLLLKPLTYMNLSGEAVQAASRYYQIPTERILVVYDDIDLPLGALRIRMGGGPGTHNGMRSLISCLNTQDFPRIRIGIGPKPEQWDLADYVLSRIPAESAAEWDKILNLAAASVCTVIHEGIESAMRTINKR